MEKILGGKSRGWKDENGDFSGTRVSFVATEVACTKRYREQARSHNYCDGRRSAKILLSWALQGLEKGLERAYIFIGSFDIIV